MERTVRQLADLVAGSFTGDGDAVVTGVSSVDQASDGAIVFADTERAFDRALASAAAAIVAPVACTAPDRPVIHVENPKLAFARIVAVLAPAQPIARAIHPTAIIDESAAVGADVAIGSWSTIGPDTVIGDKTTIGNGCSIGSCVRIGRECTIRENVTIHDRVSVADRVIVHSGAVIGSDGFGFVLDAGQFHKFPQIGDVIIEDDVEIGANTTIDRGALDSTVIGSGTKIDNLVQIAHNVRIGRNCVIAAQTGISGSATIEDGVMLGGQVGVADHVRIEAGAIAGAQAGIPTGKVIRKGTMVWGTPARPMDQFRRIFALVQNLPSLKARVVEIERRLGADRPSVPDDPTGEHNR